MCAHAYTHTHIDTYIYTHIKLKYAWGSEYWDKGLEFYLVVPSSLHLSIGYSVVDMYVVGP